MAHTGDLVFHCKALLNDFGGIPNLEEWKKSLPAREDLFPAIIKIALELRPCDRIDASDIAREFEVAESTVLRWAAARNSIGLPHPKTQALVAKWLIDHEEKYYHAFRYKGKWYLSPRCTLEEAAGLTLPDINLDDDPIRRYSNMGRSLSRAKRRIKEKQERDDAQARTDAFVPTEISVRGIPRPIIYIWYIHPERSFEALTDELAWPKLHKDVRPKPLPRLYSSREDAEFLCEPIAKKHALCMGPDGDDEWSLRIVQEENQTIYFAVNNADEEFDEDETYALGWINRVELVE